MRVVESGTGSGSLSVSLAKAILPTGHLFTFEFNPDRVVKGKADFLKLGLNDFITVTHRDVLANGFTLGQGDGPLTDGETDARVGPGSIDAIFLDLPSPQLAVPHAYAILRKRGKLCNFSPCIEQVFKATQEMAKLGFYDIRTFECLTREIEVRRHEFLPLGDLSVAKSLLPPETDDGIANKRKQKQNQKESKKVAMLATATKVEARGHTGYLTFAIKF
jgi:tRNA (adenine57-N1/adenine58-N1)-methyltransferase